MCKRRRRAKQERLRKGKTGVKKRTCCERCKRRVRKWFCRRIKQCFKKAVFGYPAPRLDDYEIAGYNLGSLKDNLKIKSSKNSFDSSTNVAKKKPSVVTLFKNNRKKSTKSVKLKDALVREFGSSSLSSIIGKMKSFVTDLRERNLFLGLSKDSKLNLNEKEKEKFRKMADKYETKSKRYVGSLLEDHKNLKKKFSLTQSKTEVLKNMLEDYTTKKFSFSKIIISNDKTNINNFNKEDLNKILNRYQSLKEKERNSSRDKLKGITANIFTRDKRISKKQLEFLKNQDSDILKKTFFLTDSKLKLLRNMADDLKKGKFFLTAIPSPLIKDRNNIQKDLTNILNYYKLQQKTEHYPFVKQSKLKQFKSDLRAKIGY
ncbi:unnamed protein product, partial [Brenthis ino]